MSHPSLLLAPTTLGALALRNRVVMAPMTRNRAADDGTPTPHMRTYYRQRAGAGLIVAEMTQVTPEGRSYLNTPGMHSDAQVAAWRGITDAVHEAGGRIVVQLAHGGRISHPSLIGRQPVAPSAITPNGTTYTADGPVPFVAPRALALGELPGLVAQFRAAAVRAREAGFDGIELHAANGYLLDQFLRSGSNARTDAYGGSAVNRARLLCEVVAAAVEVWGPGRVGVRIAPFNGFNDMRDDDPFTTFPTVARLLAAYPLAYLHVTLGGGAPAERGRMARALREAFHGAVILNDGYTADAAEAALAAGEADAIAFGSSFLANPDLVRRFARGAALNAPDPSTFYVGGERGYIDYAALEEVEAGAPA